MTLRFDDKAESYSRAAVVQRHLAVWLADWLEPLERTARLAALELGAGDGLFSGLLASRFACLTAVDLAPRMVLRGSQQLPQVEWLVADAWSFAGTPVDRIFSASLLHWCIEPVAVLRRWRSLVRRGGRMLHGFYVAPTLVDWQRRVAARSPVQWRSPAQWEAHFREAGWRIVRCQTRNHVQRFASAIEVLRFFHRTGAVAARQSSVAILRRMLADRRRKSTDGDGTAAATTDWTFFRIEVVQPESE